MATLHTENDPRHTVENPLRSGWGRWVPLGAVLFSFIYVATNYSELPAVIPIHFNARGAVDGTGGRATIWVLPAVNLFLFYLMEVAAGTKGYRWFNYPVTITEDNAYDQHRIALRTLALIRVICCVMLAYLTYVSVQAASNNLQELPRWFMGAFVLLLIGIIGWSLREAFRHQ